MRRAFAACVAFAVLVAIVVVRFGFKDPPPDAPAHPIVDAAIADAPVDALAVVLDAGPTPKKHAPRPRAKPTPTRPAPTHTQPSTPVMPTPVIPTPVVPTPGRPQCTHPPNPTGCPAKEPNVNRPCDADGVHCVYGTSCCPFEYVCNNGAFEARFTSCP